MKDNGSSGTRIRVTGSGEMMDGGAAGVNLEYGATDTLGIRYAEVWFSGGYGKVSIGQGDQGGEGSVYNGAAAVTGTGHGQDTNGIADDYYTSLDGGASRNERLRYDSADLGPISAAVSIGNGDQISAGLKLTQDLGGTTFKAGVGTIQWAGGQSTISASAGFTLDSGISISGAWGQGTDHAGAMTDMIPAGMGTDAIPGQAAGMPFRIDASEPITDTDIDGDGEDEATLTLKLEKLADQITHGIMEAEEPTDEAPGTPIDVDAVKRMYNMALAAHACSNTAEGDDVAVYTRPDEDADDPAINCDDDTRHTYAVDGVDAVPGSPAVPAMPTTTDPSMLQVAISFAFGDTSVGLSWYQSSDKQHEGSELTAIGAGVNHNLPKLGANVYAAAQNYNVTDGSYESDDTVIMIGTRIKF